MNTEENKTNEICKQIEMSIRNGCENPRRRFGSIAAKIVRDAIWGNKIGMICEECLQPSRDNGRYCCEEHRHYYKRIINQFYFKPRPWYENDRSACGHEGNSSIDHIVPIANGGLEFDRDNLQWMCLRCNISKSGGERYEKMRKNDKLNNFMKEKSQ